MCNGIFIDFGYHFIFDNTFQVCLVCSTHNQSNCIRIFTCFENAFFITSSYVCPYYTRCYTVYDCQIFALNGWRPCTTRPVPYQCLFAGFCKTIPCSFCPAHTGIQVIACCINSITLTPEACNTMYIRVATTG